MPLSSINTNIKILIASLPLLLIAFYQEWKDYFELWTNSYIYRHGLLVFPGTLFLLYLRGQNFKQLRVSFSRLGLAALVVFCLTLLLANAGNIKLVRMLLLPLLIIAWGTTIWGLPFTKTVGPPVLLVLFAAPFWDEFSPLLQWLTVAVDEGALAALGIPVTIEEFYITIPSGIFHVAHGCSGIRYLMVGLYLGAFYAVLTNSGSKRTLALILVAGFLALLSNWIRVAWIIAAGHYTNMESSLVADHEMFGWIVFVVVTLIPFFIFTHFLDKRDLASGTTSITSRIESSDTKNHFRAITSASLPIAVIPLALFGQNHAASTNAANWTPKLPTVQESSWTGPLQHAEFWHPRFKAPDFHLSGVYVSDTLARVQVDLIGYKQQRQGKELVYYENRVFDPKSWAPVAKKRLTLEENNNLITNQVNQIILKSVTGPELAVAWYWYDIAGLSGTSPTEVQLIGGFKKLVGDTRGSIWILSTECNTQVPESCSSDAKHALGELLSNLSLSQ